MVASGSSGDPTPSPRVARKVKPTASIVNRARIPSATGKESVTSRLDRLLVALDDVLFKEAPQTAQRVLPPVFLEPQVAQIVGLELSFADFFAMEILPIVSSQSWHYTSTSRVAVGGLQPEGWARVMFEIQIPTHDQYDA